MSRANGLRKRYNPEKMRAIRKLFDQDVMAWKDIQWQGDLDIQCVSTDKGDGSPAGPWPPDEWYARTRGPYKRPALHEDILTQYGNQVINQIELNPMGVEAEPLGDGADEKSAEFLEGRIRNIEYEEQARIAYLTAAKNAIERSYGFWKMETKARGDGSQKVCIEEIQDPNTVIPGFFKKAAGADMRRAWELERIPKEEFLERFPGAVVRDFESMAIEAPLWVDENTVQIAAYWHLEEDERFLLKIETPEGDVDAYEDEFENGVKRLEGSIKERKPEKRRRVLKTIMNGVEALDETEWIDPGDGEAYPPEIPILIVTGRIKYEKNRRVIESLYRKGRVGQLLYDFVISAIQETISMTPKVKVQGPEGAFDTSTPWETIHRNPVAFAEYKPTTNPETGQANEPPQWITYEPPIASLEMAKQSVMIGVQNAIGMSSTERKDRSAKSGKALDKLQEEMSVSTAHYFGALRVAQERSYRILQRILPLIEADSPELPIQDRMGQHRLETPLYTGRHAVAVGTGKLYQTLQEKQEETSSELMKIPDPNILLAVLPGALKMKGLGTYGDELARMIEAIQPPQMQAARNKDAAMPPEAMQAVQQAQEALKSMDAYSKQLERRIIELEDQIQAKVIESQTKKEISEADNQTKLQLEQMKIEAELELKRLEIEIERIRQQSAAMQTGAKLDSQETMQRRDQAHASVEGERQRQAEAENRAIEAAQNRTES